MSNSLKIIVKADKGNESNNTIQDTLNPATSQNSKSSMVARSVYAVQMVRAAENMVKNEFNYQISRYGDTTGDYIGQSNIDLTMQRVNMIASLGSTVGMGFMVGGVAGAVVGAVISIGTLAQNSVHEVQTFNLNMMKTNASASFSGSMIGSIISGGNRG